MCSNLFLEIREYRLFPDIFCSFLFPFLCVCRAFVSNKSLSSTPLNLSKSDHERTRRGGRQRECVTDNGHSLLRTRKEILFNDCVEVVWWNAPPCRAPNWYYSCLDGLTKSLWKNKVLSHGLFFSQLTVRGNTVFALPDPPILVQPGLGGHSSRL